MKVSGYALRTAIKAWEVRRDTAINQFEGSLKKFDDEDKPSPLEVSDEFIRCETVIAGLQVAQARYNLEVTVSLPSIPGSPGRTPLAYAIKVIGGLGRIEKSWRGVATGSESSRRHSYGDDDTVRDPTRLRAKATVDRKTAAGMAETMGRRAAKVRQAIAEANSTEIEVAGLDAAWFD